MHPIIKRRLKSAMIVSLMSIIFLYIIFAFSSLQLFFITWEMGARVGYALLVCMVVGISLGVFLEGFKDEVRSYNESHKELKDLIEVIFEQGGFYYQTKDFDEWWKENSHNVTFAVKYGKEYVDRLKEKFER